MAIAGPGRNSNRIDEDEELLLEELLLDELLLDTEDEDELEGRPLADEDELSEPLELDGAGTLLGQGALGSPTLS
jgi:hypothetical protein